MLHQYHVTEDWQPRSGVCQMGRRNQQTSATSELGKRRDGPATVLLQLRWELGSATSAGTDGQCCSCRPAVIVVRCANLI